MVSQDEDLDAGLKAVADVTRRGILTMLCRQRLSVLEIAEEFPMSRPAISKHLRVLKEAGLVVETPVGRQRLYAMDREPLEALTAWLADLNGGRYRLGQRSTPYRRSYSTGPAAEDWRVW